MAGVGVETQRHPICRVLAHLPVMVAKRSPVALTGRYRVARAWAATDIITGVVVVVVVVE